MGTATFIIGISQGHDIEFIWASIPPESGCAEYEQFNVGETPKDVNWPTVTLRVQGTREQCIVIFSALASACDEDEPEYSDDE